MTEFTEAIVETTARLHLGFLDMNFGLGRRFGSLGLSIDAPRTRVRLARAPLPPGLECARAFALLDRLCGEYPPASKLYLSVVEAIPAHAGLGSGTQLSLAVGAAFCALERQTFDGATLASLLDRGARSGIGAGAFDTGGFLVDGGKGALPAPAPIVARLPFPGEWSILLIFDDAAIGVHGEEEGRAFAGLPEVSEDVPGRFARLTLLKILPALAERDFEAFAEGIRALQDGMGALFAPFQGGAFRSPGVAGALAYLDAGGINGSGQSSWGPAGFAFLPPAVDEHRRLIEDLQNRFGNGTGLRFAIAKGLNRGARVEVR